MLFQKIGIFAIIATLAIVTSFGCKHFHRLKKPPKHLTKYRLCNTLSDDKKVWEPYWHRGDFHVRSVKELKNDTLKIKILTDLEHYGTKSGNSWKLSGNRINVLERDWPQGFCNDYYMDINANEKLSIQHRDSLVIIMEIDSVRQCFILDVDPQKMNSKNPENLMICE